MKGIDTNIIVRLLLRDDADQFAKARKLAEAASVEHPLCVNLLVVTETIWVLEKKSGISPELARSTMAAFLVTPEIHVPEQTVFRNWQQALSVRNGGWSDVVIAAINLENGCDFTYTLDQRAARDVAGMELLS